MPARKPTTTHEPPVTGTPTEASVPIEDLFGERHVLAGRRDLLKGAGVGLFGALAAGALAPAQALADNNQGQSGLVGSWFCDVTNQNGVPTPEAVEVWGVCTGGVLIVNGQYSDRVDIGSWRMIDTYNFEYVLAVVLFSGKERLPSDPPGTPSPVYAGAVIDEGTGRLNSDFSRHTTQHTFSVFDQCNNFQFSGQATGVATRIPTRIAPGKLAWPSSIHPGASC